MSELHDRLMKARLTAGFRSARAAALALNVRPATYAAHENGTRKFNIADARRYAAFYQVSPGWILTGENFDGDKAPRIEDTEHDFPDESVELPEGARIGTFGDSSLSRAEILDFGKHILKLLPQIDPAQNSEVSDPVEMVPELRLKRMHVGEYDMYDSSAADQWEVVDQWQFPKKFISEVLGITSNREAVIVAVDDNMSPTFEIGQHLIMDLGQEGFVGPDVYIFIDSTIIDDLEVGDIHIQRIKREGSKFILSNDNPAGSTRHIARIVEQDEIRITGRVCGFIGGKLKAKF